MSKITNNNGDLRKTFFGNAEVNKIYLGNTELYSKAAPVVTYTLSNTLSNISVDGVEVNDVSVGSIPSTVLSTDVVEMIFTCASGYEIPSSITVNGVTVGVGLGDVSANGCTANYMAFQSATNRCFIFLKNFTANTSFSVTAQQSAPSYVISAGTYYGKNNPTLYAVYVDIQFTASGTNYLEITFNLFEHTINYLSPNEIDVAFLNGSWVNNLRTITVSDNTTVTQEMYEAFFACYDRVITDLTGTTWQLNNVLNPSSLFDDGTTSFQLNFTSFEIGNGYFKIEQQKGNFESLIYNVTTVYYSDWINQNYRYIAITGGTDVTNANLISWIQANATRIS